MTNERTETHACDSINRQAAIDHFRLIIDATNTNNRYKTGFVDGLEVCISHLSTMPSAQPEIIQCKDCMYGGQDEVGRWFCRSLGCQIGNEDGSGYCADAERREG